MGDDSLTFKRLKIEGWRQFKLLDLEFHPRLTVLAGANGSGKTSIFGILSQHFGRNRNFTSVPVQKDGETDFTWKNDAWGETLLKALERPELEPGGSILGFRRNARPNYPLVCVVGTIEYTDESIGNIIVPTHGAKHYLVEIPCHKNIRGIFTSSHKPSYTYQPVTQIPTDLILPEKALHNWLAPSKQQSRGLPTHSPLQEMKQALMSMAIFGKGNSFVSPRPESSEIFEGFINILKKMLPESLEFQTLSIRIPDVVCVTDSGEWVIDEASGGIAAIIDLSWQIFLLSKIQDNKGKSFVVLIDEPENHLHPSMQRKIMPTLVEAFPQVQFIVATHSPLVVSSVKESAVYVLQYEPEEEPSCAENPSSHHHETRPVLPLETGFYRPGEKRKIVSTPIDLVAKAGTAMEVLRDVLGVPATTPEWVALDVAHIVERFCQKEFTPQTLEDMQAELDKLGMRDQFPEALAGLVKQQSGLEDRP